MKKLHYNGKGENKEYCDRVIKNILKQWEQNVSCKTTNQEGDRENEVD